MSPEARRARAQRRRWRKNTRGGLDSDFWRGEYQFRAWNEGGGPPLTLNLVLWRGWLPVAFYLGVSVFGRWFRIHPRFCKVWHDTRAA